MSGPRRRSLRGDTIGYAPPRVTIASVRNPTSTPPSAFVAAHVVDDRLDVYLRVARRNGLDDAGLTQLMILLTAYLGQPYPSAAMTAVRRTSEGLLPQEAARSGR